jgi:hypothetical protein
MLIGKIVKLPKPLVIISSDEDNDDDNDNDSTDQRKKRRLIADNDEYDGCWNVVGIVRKKLLFKTRPQPMIAKVSRKLKFGVGTESFVSKPPK